MESDDRSDRRKAHLETRPGKRFWTEDEHDERSRSDQAQADGVAAKSDSGMTALWNTATQGRSGNTGVTVATGVRGLSPDDMKNARPAPDQVQKLDGFAATKSQAESSAKSAKLSKQNIDYLVATSGGKK